MNHAEDLEHELAEMHTLRDVMRLAVSFFSAAKLHYGHGTDNAWDEARWLTLGAEYTYTNRDSNQNNFDYRKNLLLFSAKVAL